MNDFRKKPDEKLVSQLVIGLTNDGTTEIQATLSHLFTGYLLPRDLQPWKQQKKVEAQRFLLGALSLAKTSPDFEQALGTLLHSFGGGRVHLRLAGDAIVRVTVKTSGENVSISTGSSNITPKNLGAAVVATQEEIRNQHPELR